MIFWEYVEPEPQEEHRRFYDFMHGDFHVLEKLSVLLSYFRLPEPLMLEALPSGDCAQYAIQQGRHVIQFCNGMFKQLSALAPPPGQRSQEGYSRDEVLSGAIWGIMLHETGHALFDMLEVPVFGREEDAADQMAVFLALEARNRDVTKLVIAGLAHLQRAWSKIPGNRLGLVQWTRYTDEHSSWEHRYRNTVCLAYGGDREAFKDFTEAAGLRGEDLDHCIAEYRQIRQAFETTIRPFVDHDRLQSVRTQNLATPTTITGQ